MTDPDVPGASDPDGAVTLRHRDASRQALMYGIFAATLLGVIALVIALELPGRWWSLALLPLAVFGVYSATRLATLKVRLDPQGLWEPNPFRLTYVTPWSDLKRVDTAEKPGRVPFLTVRVTHADGDTHDVVALNVQAGAAYAEPALDGWVRAIRDAKKRWA